MDKGYWFKSISVLGLGICTIIWIIIKVLSSIFISVYFTNTFTGFTGYGWWACTIIIFSIICRLVLNNNVGDDYQKLVDKVVKNNINDLDLATANVLDNNAIFNILKENYKKYNTKLIFFDNTEFIISKNQETTYDGDFIFLVTGNDSYYIYDKGFNINNINRVETIN